LIHLSAIALLELANTIREWTELSLEAIRDRPLTAEYDLAFGPMHVFRVVFGARPDQIQEVGKPSVTISFSLSNSSGESYFTTDCISLSSFQMELRQSLAEHGVP
jgi:hypothetical protein